MIHYVPDWKEDRVHLNRKCTQILITNVCNLSCGGCNQLCGHFPKEKLWFISLEDLKMSISAVLIRADIWWKLPDFPEKNKFIALYGGEPTLHPDWEGILEVLYSYSDVPFMVFTNGRTFPDKTKLPKTGDPRFVRGIFEAHDKAYNHSDNLQYRYAHHRNVGYRLDYKDADTANRFNPTLVAPIDVLGIQDRSFYFEKAKKHCVIWRECENIVYNNKAYFCTVAGAMDWLFHDGKHGWQVDGSSNPFHKTNQDIKDQAQHFCYRCAWCCTDLYGDSSNTSAKQYMNKPTLATKTNYDAMHSKKLELIQLEIRKRP